MNHRCFPEVIYIHSKLYYITQIQQVNIWPYVELPVTYNFFVKAE